MYDRVFRPRILKSIQKALQTEISKAFGLWFAAAIVCLIMSFAWMSAHYDRNHPAFATANQEPAEPALGAMSEP